MPRGGYISLAEVQRVRKVVLLAALLLSMAGLAVTRPEGFGASTHELIEHFGWALIGVCILGRVWCSLYIGGRKVRELVTNGPYSVVRNPLYVFSFIGAAGVGLSTSSLTIGAVLAVATWLIFAAVVRKEEAALLKVHGQPYAAYMISTPRFLPNPALWWDVPVLDVRPVRLVRTFFDGLVFLLAIPLTEGLEYLQNVGWMPTFFGLP